MVLVTLSWLVAAAAVLGGALLAIFALIRAVFWRFRPAPLAAKRAEFWALSASVVAAVLGSGWLLFGPAYSGTTSSVALSPNGVVSESSVETSQTFVEANGRSVIPLITVPVAFALLPFAFWRFRPRPLA